jgi:hypothetical protein
MNKEKIEAITHLRYMKVYDDSRPILFFLIIILLSYFFSSHLPLL